MPRGGPRPGSGRLIWPDGTPAEPLPLEPFAGTPALTDKRDHPAPLEQRERFEVAEVEAPENLVRLDRFKAQRDNDDEPPGAA